VITIIHPLADPIVLQAAFLTGCLFLAIAAGIKAAQGVKHEHK
jgi:hypothetical protein